MPARSPAISVCRDPALTARSLVLDGGGRISEASLFHGTITNADVHLQLNGGALNTTFNGQFDRIDPAVAFGSPSVEGALSGSANVRTTVRDLLADTIALDDYDIDGTVDVHDSTLRGARIDRAHAAGALQHAVLRLSALNVAGPAVTGNGAGTLAFTDASASQFDYHLTQLDLAQLQAHGGPAVSGMLATDGHLSGPYRALRLAGNATVTQISAPGATALQASGAYNVTIPSGVAAQASARIDRQRVVSHDIWRCHSTGARRGDHGVAGDHVRHPRTAGAAAGEHGAGRGSVRRRGAARAAAHLHDRDWRFRRGDSRTAQRSRRFTGAKTPSTSSR